MRHRSAPFLALLASPHSEQTLCAAADTMAERAAPSGALADAHVAALAARLGSHSAVTLPASLLRQVRVTARASRHRLGCAGGPCCKRRRRRQQRRTNTRALLGLRAGRRR
jgi:hypothetical protein